MHINAIRHMMKPHIRRPVVGSGIETVFTLFVRKQRRKKSLANAWKEVRNHRLRTNCQGPAIDTHRQSSYVCQDCLSETLQTEETVNNGLWSNSSIQ
jgi:hypothetical protein